MKSFSDSQLLDYNYQETEQVYSDNGLPVDDEWTRASMSPLSHRQDFCVSWLENYFDSCGDHSPNSELTKISEPEKKSLFNKYVEDMVQIQLESVNYTRFLEIWNVLFPRFVSRGYVAVRIYTYVYISKTMITFIIFYHVHFVFQFSNHVRSGSRKV